MMGMVNVQKQGYPLLFQHKCMIKAHTPWVAVDYLLCRACQTPAAVTLLFLTRQTPAAVDYLSLVRPQQQ